MITNKSFCFVTAFRSNFNGLVRIRNSVCTCLDGFTAGLELFRFPAWVQFFVSGVTCSARAPSVVLVWRLEMACFAVAWRHRESSPPQPLTSWLRYGFGTVLDPLRWLVSLRESPAGRLPGQPCARLSAPSSGAPESCKREEKRERAARASSFQLSGLDAAHRRLIESDCPYGAELHPCPWFSGAMPTRHLIFNSTWKITYRSFMSVVNIH